jgi:hypothetical protein
VAKAKKLVLVVLEESRKMIMRAKIRMLKLWMSLHRRARRKNPANVFEFLSIDAKMLDRTLLKSNTADFLNKTFHFNVT